MPLYPPSLSPAPALTDEMTLEASVECLLEHLPFERAGAYSTQDTCESLADAPSSSDIRYHLNQLSDLSTLEQQVNQALQSRILPKIAKRKQKLAIDLNLIPFYGTVTEIAAPYIDRAQAKAGTTRFFAYATIDVICRNKRVTLGIHALPQSETLVATVTDLLDKISKLRVGIQCLYLDRGFYRTHLRSLVDIQGM
jgi:hypothetical protein